MCFYIQDSRLSPLVAKRDIVCYKYGTVHPDHEGEEVFCSRYQCHYYRFGKENERVPLRVIYSTYSTDLYINKGYHSYSNVKKARKCATNYNRHIARMNRIQILLGARRSKLEGPGKLVKCIIPKGTTYYYNSGTHEYVSEQIIIQSVL